MVSDLRRAEAVGAVAHRLRHRVDDVVDSEDTKGISMMPITIPAVMTDDDEVPRPSGSAR
jgi:hypothetical protein